MAGMSTYPFKCDLCGGVTEAPTYGDFACQHCGQAYVYDEGHQIKLSERQLQTLRASRWIAVSERMPADGEWVWCYGPNRGCEAACISKYWDGWVGTDRKNLVAGAYTHWMPLPPEPSEAAR
jgi:hypothetical protein